MVKEKEVKEVKKEVIIELTDLPGIGPVSAERLQKLGFTTIESIAAAPVGSIACEETGIPIEDAKKAIAAAQGAVEVTFDPASNVERKIQSRSILKTGSEELDNLLGGGFETQNITELYGKYSSGKSQVCFQACVNVQKPKEEGGLGGGVLFIDTEGTFRPDRVRQMAQHAGMNPQEVLDNIFFARALSSDHQVLLVEKSKQVIEQKKIKLMVIDSLMALFRSEFVGRGMLADRQQRLNKHLRTLSEMCEKYDIPILITNQVMDNPGLMFGDPIRPIGGNILGHATTRIYLRKAKDEKRIARMVDSPHLPEGECVFKVTAEGIKD